MQCNTTPFGKPLPHCNQVDLWLLPVDELTNILREEYDSILSSKERDFSKQIIIQDEKDLYVSARALLRTLLYRYTNLPTLEWHFEKNSFGRPYITHPQQHRNIRFNISHTSGLVACSISTSHEVGVDIESILQNRNFHKISRDFFSEQEANSLNSIPPHEVKHLFYTYWTLKEAYLKARGIGLSLPLSSFWFELSMFPRIFFSSECKDTSKNWRFISKSITNKHLLALAIRTNSTADINVRVYQAQPHSLGELRIDTSYIIDCPVSITLTGPRQLS